MKGLMDFYANKGEQVTTEDTHIPVYEFLEDVYPWEPMNHLSVKSVCDLPDPKFGDEIITKYRGETFNKNGKFHFNNGGYR